ncbi:MAG: SCO family protein [Gemmatimonadales bacterium]|nr:SCO family protein [Gemmatimonadales bacterium]
MTTAPRTGTALTALGVILVITVSWWALALWPIDPGMAPEWLTRTREVCFGTTGSGLPNAGGWLLLVGQPLGMLIVLVAVWGKELAQGGRRLLGTTPGQLLVGVSAALLLAGVGGVVLRVQTAGAEPFASSPTERMAGGLTRVNDTPPTFALVDQAGDTISLDRFEGRPVIVTFAFAHCEAICPLIVNDVLLATSRLGAHDPAVLILTLDPWRDTPSRLASMAEAWGVTGDVHVLSGTPEVVERALNAWRVPRVRNERTGDLVHPALVYVISRTGRISYVLNGSASMIQAAVEAL